MLQAGQDHIGFRRRHEEDGALDADRLVLLDGFLPHRCSENAHGDRRAPRVFRQALQLFDAAFEALWLAEAADRHNAVNTFIRTGNVFDAVADFEAATIDPATGSLKPEFQPNSSVGGPGDLLHPNRAGYQAMANAVSLSLFGL